MVIPRIRTRSKTILVPLVIVSIVEAAIVGFAVWRWWHPRPQEPDPNWTADVTVVAGDGIAGFSDGDSAHARFSEPFGVAIGRDGTVYVADAGNAPRVRAIAPDGRVSTVAGGERGYADGSGAAAKFNAPSGLAADGEGNVYVADTGNNAIRRIAPDGSVSTVAGDPEAGYRDGMGRDARFNGPVGVAVDVKGRIIVADTYNDRIRSIERDGSVRTIAGSLPGMNDGTSADARFDTPCGVVVDGSGTIYVADAGNGLVRTIDGAGRVGTVAIPMDQLSRPIAVAVNAIGDRFAADERGRIVEVARDGASRVIAGSGPGFRDGMGSEARFRRPSGIAAAAPRRLIVADGGNALVRLVSASSEFEPRPPPAPRIAPHFDAEAFGSVPLLWPVAPLEGPHEVAGTIGEARGAEGSERFHAGIDVRSPEGTTVQAVRDGMIASPIATAEFGTINESLRVGSLAYVHIRVGRDATGQPFDDPRFAPKYDPDGRLAGMRVKRGARFTTGEAIGTVNAFNHVHMNVGWPGEEYNPLAFQLVRFEDTIPPTIARGGVRLLDEQGQPLKDRVRGRLLVSGRVQIVVDAWDAANGNKPGRRLGLYDLGFQVLNRDGSPAQGFEGIHHTMRFDRLSIEPDAARLVYAPGSGIPFYRGGRTRFLYIVTDSFRNGVASQGMWDTTLLPPGDYIVRVWAADFAGNSASTNRDLPVTIAAPASSATTPVQGR